MKFTTRILMGILFPFILIITVSSISKALKPEKTQLIKEIPSEFQSETNQKSSELIPSTLVVNRE